MTPQEQLIIYAAYLPYKLKIGFEGEDLKHSFVGMNLSDELMLISPYGDFGRAKIEKCKPILYDLTNFEKYFANLFDTDIDVRTFLNEGFSDMINNYKVEWWPYGVIQLALKHHFNVFGIPAGEFIDKATLKTESNE